MFVDSLSEYFIASLLIVFTVQCGVVDKIRRCSPISLKHVCVRCLLFDPCLTPHQPNVDVDQEKLPVTKNFAVLLIAIFLHVKYLDHLILLQILHIVF